MWLLSDETVDQQEYIEGSQYRSAEKGMYKHLTDVYFDRAHQANEAQN